LRVLVKFEKSGAEFVHIVDLDGAKDPSQRQTKLLASLVRATPLKIQVGGGIRTEADVANLFDTGVDRVVIGTLAAEHPTTVSKMLKKFGSDRFTIALDLFTTPDGDVTIATRGWLQKSDILLESLMDMLVPGGLKRVLCTDISKDGMMAGPNLDLYSRLSSVFQVEIQASGGVRSIEDLLALKAIPVHSAVVGKAIYENGLDLAEAIRQC
jgi:phosphoribosylformimino-5-aminoimidazole carboxamide ribotide isomerase